MFRYVLFYIGDAFFIKMNIDLHYSITTH